VDMGYHHLGLGNDGKRGSQNGKGGGWGLDRGNNPTAEQRLHQFSTAKSVRRLRSSVYRTAGQKTRRRTRGQMEGSATWWA